MITLVMLAAMAVVNALQLALLIKLARRVTGVERLNERLSHFAEALSLLTDTTEQGLGSIAASLTEAGRKTTTRGTTKSATKRIVTAVKGGRSIATVAAEMGMSESEIRLHLELGGMTASMVGGEHGSLRV
jgi:hypothetical protein